MKNYLKVLSLIFLASMTLIQSGIASQKSWQEISMPSADDVASAFAAPPVEYGMTFYWGWDGNVTEEVIARDMNAFSERNVRIVTIEPGYGMSSPYLSTGWFDNVQLAVEQARHRGMRVWLVDEGKYPSGFAGGKFSAERPDLRMQALVVAERIAVDSGETISRKLAPETVSAVAVNRDDNSNQIIDISSGELNWTAPEGRWQVLLVQHQFRTSQTRAVNNPTRSKDTSNSLCDYLNPEATKQFIKFTHEQYKKYVGSEFGRTVLGFRGDEPDYSIRGIPWTSEIFAEFERRNGYDVRPYVASFFARHLTDKQKRIKADYWDVWSDLFSENFFGVQAKWCADNSLQYLVHLNHEDKMPDLVRSEGDFFKAMRQVQMPGIDAIWDQIWPGKVTDYPKYASSAAHLFGRPRTFTESFAAYRPQPDVEQAKLVLDYQLVRGINMVEVMFVPASSNGKLGLSGWLESEQFPDVAAYINRASFILSQGRPAAQIALYHPTTSIWLGDEEANTSVLSIAQNLLERQRDFDFVDEQSLCSILKLEDGSLKNLSGQSYRAVIIPSVTAISKTTLDRLHAFADSGGKVFFVGRTPSMVNGKNFLNASVPPNLNWAMIETSGELTDNVMEALPQPDVKLAQPCPAAKYTHRKWRDAELYFFFNESREKKSLNAMLAGSGQAQLWDATKGSIETIDNTYLHNGFVHLPLVLEPYETKFIVTGPAPVQSAAKKPASQIYTRTFNVKKYGAKGDGMTLDTEAINETIEAAAAEGGGTVHFPAGTYLSYSIHLKSNITLYLDQGATILAAEPNGENGYDPAEPNPTDMYQDFGHSHWHDSLIWGESIENVSILGPGLIHGKGLDRWDSPKAGRGNKAIALKLCRNVIIRDVSFLLGGHFCILATGVDNMTIDNIKIDTNRDGINIDCCRNVRVSNCTVNSPFDDGICLKSSYGLGFARATENVTITNCQLSGYDPGTLLDGTYQKNEISAPDKNGLTGRIKFGTESNGGFKNITISNCVFYRCRGLALETVDGGLLEDVSIMNITMRDVTSAPVFLRLGRRMRGPEGVPVGKLRRVNISNVTAYNADPKYGSIISGIPGHDIEDIKLSNIRFYYKGGGTKEQAALEPPENEKDYPEPSMFGEMPAYGFFIRHVNDIELSNVEVSYLAEELRPAFVLNDVKRADFHCVKAQHAQDVPTFVLKDVEDLDINQCQVPDVRLESVKEKEF